LDVGSEGNITTSDRQVFERLFCGSPCPPDKRAAPDPDHVDINPRDASELALAPDDGVKLLSRRGAVRVRVKVAEGIGRGRARRHDGG
jgi:anaerobic selenocysteine-containing dehydrogenase